jgi:squalene-hopene/tetraprenyl-beta-curcumene cyclase
LATALDSAIPLAQGYLMDQARRDFAEARHEMTFPRWAGFRAKPERQSGDIFARAVLASVCLDLAELGADDGPAAWPEIARREADYVAASRLADRDGGWSYFPDLPELPPDLDSLAAALSLFSRIAPQHLPLCDEPMRWALEEQRADGALETWILAPTNTRAQLKLMRRGIRWYWGAAIDVEVCARFLLALGLRDAGRFSGAIRRGAEFIAARQQPSGLWDSTWYWGEVYGTGLCMRLLRELAIDQGAVTRAAAALWRSQREDGGWGRWESVPLDTALAIWALAADETLDATDRMCRGASVLLAHQAPDGSWPATPWIKMDVGRAMGRVSQTLTYQSRTVTTAFALRSLLLLRRRGSASS